MISKSGEEIIINDVNLVTCNNAFVLQWDSNIGWGEMTFYTDKETKQINVETECMSDNDDKRFIKLVLDKFIEKLEVVE